MRSFLAHVSDDWNHTTLQGGKLQKRVLLIAFVSVSDWLTTLLPHTEEQNQAAKEKQGTHDQRWGQKSLLLWAKCTDETVADEQNMLYYKLMTRSIQTWATVLLKNSCYFALEWRGVVSMVVL